MNKLLECTKQLEDCFYQAKKKSKEEKVTSEVGQLMADVEFAIEALIVKIEKDSV